MNRKDKKFYVIWIILFIIIFISFSVTEFAVLTIRGRYFTILSAKIMELEREVDNLEEVIINLDDKF